MIGGLGLKGAVVVVEHPAALDANYETRCLQAAAVTTRGILYAA